MCFDRLGADREPFCNLAVGGSAGDQSGDPELAGGEVIEQRYVPPWRSVDRVFAAVRADEPKPQPVRGYQVVREIREWLADRIRERWIAHRLEGVHEGPLADVPGDGGPEPSHRRVRHGVALAGYAVARASAE